MKEVLEAKGWVMYSSCTCGGGRQFYINNSKPGYEVRIRTKNKTFTILQKNMVIGGPFWGYQLEDKLLNLV